MANSVELPLITVVTVVFNAVDALEETILSVLGQTYPRLEYIVIDGGSTDGSLDVIRQYEQRISFWSSDKDRGIYDAMNQGLAKVNGDWVNFMNAGDMFYSSQTVADIFTANPRGATIIYGGVEILYPDLRRIELPGSPARLWQGMQFSHQAAFIDTKYHQAHPYNITNSIAADLEFFYQAYQEQVSFVATDKVIAKVITGGVSEVKRVKTFLSSADAVCGARRRPFIRLYFYGRALSALMRSAAKRCLPRSLVKKVIQMKSARSRKIFF
jgi:glycosyltransferase involved in cell wall biosynthesis